MKRIETEHWQHVESLYQSALDLEPDAREQFLKEACGDDDRLRHEVESLIEHFRKAADFLEAPALDVLAKKMALEKEREIQEDLSGQTFLHYHIREKIGEGGMGHVYRAEDSNLSRQVAVKVLPAEFADDAERLARFEREAKLLAALSHPNIASIYGLEQVDGKPLLVLEFVEGRTLEDRLRKGRIPVHETLEICCQIAEGLEAAHEKGIIHRDLKPANVKVTPAGRAKILDFGLARLLRDQAAIAGASHSTRAVDDTTLPGAVLGTTVYMSPEQARGRPVDRRTDIWAFGCILYECLTGRRPFEGKTAMETLSFIISREPDWRLLPATTPPALQGLIKRCLQKDPKERLHDISDARIEIHDAAAALGSRAGSAFPARRMWKPRTIFTVAFGIVFLVLAGVAVWNWSHRPEPAPKPLMRLAITLPADAPLAPAGLVSPAHDRPALALSPDGSRLAYVALVGGETQLCVREMRTGKITLLPDTMGAHTPFFSPDGTSIGFFADGKLKRTPSNGGVALVLAEAPDPWGAIWGTDGTLYFNRGEGEGISSVAMDTGETEVLAAGSHYMPELLGPGQGLLATSGWHTVYLEKGRTPRFITDGFAARYVPTGHLLFAEAGMLLAAPFDRSRVKVTGPPVLLVEDLRSAPFGVAQFAVGQDGTLIYVSGRYQSITSFVLVNRKGVKRFLGLPENLYEGYDLSPDGKHLAVTQIGKAPEREIGIWIYDLLQGSGTRLTPLGAGHRAVDVFPRWAPDGRHIVHDRFQAPVTASTGRRSTPARRRLTSG